MSNRQVHLLRDALESVQWLQPLTSEGIEDVARALLARGVRVMDDPFAREPAREHIRNALQLLKAVMPPSVADSELLGAVEERLGWALGLIEPPVALADATGFPA